MENNQIKKEVNQEADAFMKALEERDKSFTIEGHWTKEEIDAAIKSMADSSQFNQALRYNQGKLKWSLVDWKSLEPMVRVLEMGAKKYAPYNWTKGMPVTEISESLLRHMFAYLDGENLDQESKIEHLGHVMCNCMFLIYMMREKPEFDNRVKINKNDNGQ